MKKLLATVGILSLVSMSVAAQPKTAVELLLGQADQETEFNGDSVVSGDDLSMGLRGAFEFNENIALEVSYMAYGEVDEKFVDEDFVTVASEVEASALKVGIKGTFPVANGFSLVGRLGVARWDFEATTKYTSQIGEDTGDNVREDDNGVDIFYGIGAQYSITDNLRVGLEYTILDMDVTLEGEDFENKVKNLALSAGYLF